MEQLCKPSDSFFAPNFRRCLWAVSQMQNRDNIWRTLHYLGDRYCGKQTILNIISLFLILLSPFFGALGLMKVDLLGDLQSPLWWVQGGCLGLRVVCTGAWQEDGNHEHGVFALLITSRPMPLASCLCSGPPGRHTACWTQIRTTLVQSEHIYQVMKLSLEIPG